MRCNSCELLVINGIVCHEVGCPDRWRDEIRECGECGSRFKPQYSEQRFCSHSCAVAFSGTVCDCSDCIVERIENWELGICPEGRMGHA